MSERRQKAIRRIQKTDYAVALMRWRLREPPKWRFLKYYLWQMQRPKRTW